jgi:hypothetical protein
MARSSIRIIPADELVKKRGTFRVFVMNHGQSSFNFGPENFNVRLADGSPVPIITYEQLRREEKHRQTWRRIAAGLQAASNSMNASNAGYTSGTANFQASSFDAYGRTQTYGVANWTAYDPARAQAAQMMATEQNQRIFANLADRNAAGLGGLSETMRTTTVDPQRSFGGALMFELPDAVRSSKSPVPVTITVTIDGEVHSIAAVFTPR